MYGAIPEKRDDVKKVIDQVLSLLTENGLCNLLCEKIMRVKFQVYNRSNACKQREVSVG